MNELEPATAFPSTRAVALAGLQTLQTGIFIVRAFYVIFQMESPEVAFNGDPEVIGHRLRFEAARAVGVAIPALLAAVGLWQGRGWAYWLCVATTAAAIIMVASGGFSAQMSGGETFALLLPLGIQFVFSVLPTTRMHVLGNSN